MDRHKDSVNFIDFKHKEGCDPITASCSDEGLIVLYSYGSNRQDGPSLKSTHDKNPPEVKVCKFIPNSDLLVSADLDGFMHFFAVPPNPLKNQCLLSIENSAETEVGTKVNFPIRAMDYDEEKRVLYTGDEMGYMHQWYLGDIIDKLDDVHEQEKLTQKKADFEQDQNSSNYKNMSQQKTKNQGTFVTGVKQKDHVKFNQEDVTQLNKWKAHQDQINCISFIPEL